jgi:predicted Zn-dependent protease
MREAGAGRTRRGNARARAGGGERPPGGTYRVVFGPQPIAEILNYMVIPSLSTAAFHAASTAYHGRFGAQVMDARLTLLDDPAAARGAILRRLTCEGLHARRTTMIRDGRLVGLLSNFYDSHRLATDEIAPRNSGRSAPSNPASRPTADIDWARARCVALTPIRDRRQPTC